MVRPLYKVLTLAVALAAASGAFAQDKTQSLADIRSEVATLAAQVQALKSELVAGGAPALQAAGGASALDRMNSIEAELSKLTSQTEQLQLRVEKVVTDGTNRVGDLEFRLCELEKGCDTSKLPETPLLGGKATTGVAATGTASAKPDPAVTAVPTQDFAVNEKSDFDQAKAAFDAGDFPGAAGKFATFAETYPGGPLTGDAQVLQGDALSQTGDTTGAAKAYLAAFSGAPKGPSAPKSLLKLGAALGLLGQTQDACVTLGEVGVRFPQAPEAADAAGAMQKLGCQ